MRDAERLPWIPVRQLGGRTDEMALVCTVLSRSDRRGADLLDALAAGPVTPDQAVKIAGIGYGTIDPGAPLSWDFVKQFYGKDVLRKAYDVMMSRLSSG